VADRDNRQAINDCECIHDGSKEFFCHRHGINKPAHFVELCKYHKDYWDAWEAGRGPRQNTTSKLMSKQPQCIHRGSKLGVISLQVDHKTPVHHCKLHNAPCVYQMPQTEGKPVITWDDGSTPLPGELGVCYQSCQDYAPINSFDPYPQQPPLGGQIWAVTALSTLPKHLSRQPVCLDSWKRLGLSIAAVNTPDEIKQLKPLYPQVDYWHPSNKVSSQFKTSTQLITSLTDFALLKTEWVMVINSDIEIHGSQAELLECVKDPNVITLGIRWNYSQSDKVRATREQWGIDAFIMSPQAALTLPRLGFAIGKPVWDYWLPLHFWKNGFTIEAIADRYFYHESHPLHWSKPEWLKAVGWLKEHYNYPEEGEFNSKDFRNLFPYGPSYVHHEVHRSKNPIVPVNFGPGSELKSLLSWVFEVPSSTCKCNEREQLMNIWGPVGCRNNMETILIWLKESAINNGIPYSETATKGLVLFAILRASSKEKRQSKNLTALERLELQRQLDAEKANQSSD
jgi:hypothetical protein